MKKIKGGGVSLEEGIHLTNGGGEDCKEPSLILLPGSSRRTISFRYISGQIIPAEKIGREGGEGILSKA